MGDAFGVPVSMLATVVDSVDRPPADPVVPEVGFDDVRFAYGDDLPEVLHGVSFSIRPGETVALVGPSGAGKSTCANLLLRLWDANGGSVSIGGHDVRLLSIAAGGHKLEVEVDNRVFTVEEGARFDENFRLVNIDEDRRCARFLFGDQSFTLCLVD